MTLPVSGSVPKKVQDFVEGLHEVHKAVRDNLVRANSKYKQDADQKRRQVDFEVGDFVWAILTKDRFPVGEYNKLSAKKIGPLEIVEKINSNAYRLKLPSHIRCSDVFNVKHLLPYHGDSSDDDIVVNSRANFVYPGENDAGPSIEERAILFLEAHDRVKKGPLFKRNKRLFQKENRAVDVVCKCIEDNVESMLRSLTLKKSAAVLSVALDWGLQCWVFLKEVLFDSFGNIRKFSHEIIVLVKYGELSQWMLTDLVFMLVFGIYARGMEFNSARENVSLSEMMFSLVSELSV
ncbi:hypothetical protein Tco_0668481 [Tanacetum coccineum]